MTFWDSSAMIPLLVANELDAFRLLRGVVSVGGSIQEASGRRGEA